MKIDMLEKELKDAYKANCQLRLENASLVKKLEEEKNRGITEQSIIINLCLFISNLPHNSPFHASLVAELADQLTIHQVYDLFSMSECSAKCYKAQVSKTTKSIFPTIKYTLNISCKCITDEQKKISSSNP